jgi:hypothetical protein
VSLIAAPADRDRIAEILNDAQVTVESVECKASSIADASEAARLVAFGLEVFVEPSRLTEFDDMAPALARSGASGKIRTGGVTNDAFPSPHEVLAFLQACLKAGLRFKATAGLHHPLRAEYRLTYEPGSACGTMFGFLNLFLAAAYMRAGLDDREAGPLLEEREPGAIRFDASGVEWRSRRLDLAALSGARDSAILSFGSCSFTEPMGDLASLGLLPG